MFRLVRRIVTVGLWVAATVFLFRARSMQALVGYFAASSTLLGLEWFTKSKPSENPALDHDLSLLAAFRSELSFRPTIEFLRDHDFGASFELTDVHRLDDFCLRWTDAAHEFLDKRLESKKASLVRLGREFTVLVGQLTWRFEGGGQSVKGSPTEDPSIWEERSEQLNAKSTEVVRAHQALEREAIRWGGRRSAGDVLALGLAVVVMVLPAWSFVSRQRDEIRSLREELALVELQRDSLAVAIRRTTEESRAKADSVREGERLGVRNSLSRLRSEGARLKDLCFSNASPPEREIALWTERVVTTMQRSKLEDSYIESFRNPPPAQGWVYDGRTTEFAALVNALDSRLEVLRGIIQELRK